MLCSMVELNISKVNNPFYHFSLKCSEQAVPKGIITWNLAYDSCLPQWVNLEHSTPKPALDRFLWEIYLTPWNNWNALGKPHFQSESSQAGCRVTKHPITMHKGERPCQMGNGRGGGGREPPLHVLCEIARVSNLDFLSVQGESNKTVIILNSRLWWYNPVPKHSLSLNQTPWGAQLCFLTSRTS